MILSLLQYIYKRLLLFLLFNLKIMKDIDIQFHLNSFIPIAKQIIPRVDNIQVG